MTRFLFAPLLVLALAPPSFAQDMPLSQILIDGEGWKKVEGKSEKPKGVKIEPAPVMDEKVTFYDITLPPGKTFRVDQLPGVSYWLGTALVSIKRDAPTAALLTPDGGTLYVGGSTQLRLWAYRVDKDGKATARDGYAALRLDHGQPVGVSSLATDTDGRIYAATDLGVQVFDPTGRLCGVLTPAAPGEPEHLAFEGDTLTHWIGDVKYARKLNTTGAK